MTPFATLLAQLEPAGEDWRVDPTDDWRQGRTLFGGISAALCLAACQRSVTDLPPLRSAQIAYIGPSAGAVTMRPAILRRGKSVTFMACDLIADGALATRTLLAFGGGRSADNRLPPEAMPAVPPPQDCPPLWTGSRPGFVQHFDQRLADGAPPNGGAAQGELLVWARHNDAGDAAPLAALVAIGDALPPAAMSRVTASTIISTISWHIDIVEASAFDATRYVLLRSIEDAAAEGYSSQNLEMWSESGILIALGRQNVAVFG